MNSNTLPTLDPRVRSLGAFRVMGETGRDYPATGVTGSQVDQHRAVEHIFRQAAACGMVGTDHHATDYAVLDGYDADGNLIVDYGIRTAQGFRFLYRKLNWRLDRPPSNRRDHS